MKLIHNVVNGLRFLKDKCELLHLDVKPDNTMVDVPANCFKLIDFGCAQKVSGDEHSHCGTHAYMAYEVFHPKAKDQRSRIFDERADIFSLAWMVVDTAFGRHVFIQNNSHRYVNNPEKPYLCQADGRTSKLKLTGFPIGAGEKEQCDTVGFKEDIHLMWAFASFLTKLLRPYRGSDQGLFRDCKIDFEDRPGYDEIVADRFFEMCENKKEYDLRKFVE